MFHGFTKYNTVNVNTNIKNIIFDLGKVLLNLDFEASIKAFQKLGLQKDVLDNHQAYSDPVFYELDSKRINDDNYKKDKLSFLRINNNSKLLLHILKHITPILVIGNLH